MDKQYLQQLREIPIEEVAARLGLDVSRHKALCPFHNDHHPSLSFNPRRNTYRCFVCDAHGGTIDLVMHLLHKTFPEACQWLSNGTSVLGGFPADRASISPSKIEGVDAKRTGACATNSSPLPGSIGDMACDRSGAKLGEVPVRAEECVSKPFDPSRYSRFFDHPYLSPAARHFLFDQRRLDPRVVRWCRLTSWRDRNGVDWLQIPYYDRDHHLIGIQNRNLNYQKDDGNLISSPLPGSIGDMACDRSGAKLGEVDARKADGGVCQPRFKFPQGSQCHIYNLPILNRLKPGEPLYIAEGASDCWALLSSGLKAIAIPSATLLSKKDISDLRIPTSDLHMFPDQDLPGERLFLQLKNLLPNLTHHHLPPDCKDFSDYYLQTVNRKPYISPPKLGGVPKGKECVQKNP